jgi:hypothetical protein
LVPTVLEWVDRREGLKAFHRVVVDKGVDPLAKTILDLVARLEARVLVNWERRASRQGLIQIN